MAQDYPSLSHLIALDKSIGDLIQTNTRSVYLAVHRILKARFQYYYKTLDQGKHGSTSEPDWLPLFFADMQELLLAELELRLQPLYGIIEAVEETMTA